MKKLSFLFGLLLLVMVFCPQARGEMLVEIKASKIIVSEKTTIKTGDLPSQDFQIPDEIAGELFSGQKEEHIFDQEIITGIDLFNSSLFPKPLGKIITTKVVYSEKVGWVSEILKEQPTVFALGLLDKASIGVLIIITMFFIFALKAIILAPKVKKVTVALKVVLGMLGCLLLSLFLRSFLDIFKEIKLFPEFLLWYFVNIIALLAIYFLSKFCVSFYLCWIDKRMYQKEKKEDEKRKADSTKKALSWLSQQHRD